MNMQLNLQRALVLLGSVVAGAAVTTACGSDNTATTPPPTGTGGVAGSAGSAGSGGSSGTSGMSGTSGVAGSSGSSAGTAGSAGAAQGGSAGSSAGSAGKGGEAGEAGATSQLVEQMVVETDLSSDQVGVAASTVAGLQNAWGLAINSDALGGPLFWVSANGTGTSLIYDVAGTAQSLVVTIPTVGDAGTSAPTGQFFNPTTAFKGDKFVFCTEDGTIAGWQTGATAVTRVDQSAASASYKGLAMVTNGSTPMIAAANFFSGKVDVFDTDYAPVAGGKFADPQVPAGFAPFNVVAMDGKVFVAYAKQDATKSDEVDEVGAGYVSVFNTDGTLASHLLGQGVLNAPWGLAVAPAGFGDLGGNLLVGNFGDGKVHAYDLATGEMTGQLVKPSGAELVIDGLWALAFGPNVATADLSQQLFFTAGPVDETHGLFGKLTAAQ
ncbi:MAG TPA: TIGR03118 family protein [Polyangiaceae bacterium]|jgi:uncharacterized protein (TIGR03118 family)